MLKDIKFEDAFVKHYEYISYLIKNKKIKVDFNVFTEMLQESYITNESPEYSRQTEDDRKKAREGGYEIKNKYFKDLIIYERDNINNVLTKEQSEKILEYINDTYTIIQNGPDKLSELEGLFVGELCVITLEVECYPYNSIKLAIIVKKDGTFIDDNFSEAKIINKEYILYTKLSSDFIIDTKDRDSYYEYETIKEQGILNSNLEVIYKGELGDIEKVKNFGDFLILEKSKFTDIEKEKIRHYITYELNNDEIMDCTDCGSDAIWDQSEECFVCEECGNRFYDKTFRPNEDWWLTPFKLSAAEDFKDMLKHPSVSDGLFLIEKYQNEYYDDWEMENSDWDYDDSWETETEEERNKFIDAKLYAVFSIKKKDLVFPFQELKINIKGRWDNQEIYLKDESWISYEYKYQKNLSKIEWYADSEPFDRQEYSFLHIINSGERFFTIFDKFHNGEYVGQTLASVFNKYSEKVIELQTKDLIFIGTNALHQLYQKFGTTKKELLTKLIRIRDFKLDYQDRLISSIDDSIIGKIHSGYKKSTFGGIWPREEFNFYEGRSIKDIVKEDPLYIKGLIKGRNIIVSYSFKSDLEKNSLLDDQLKAAIDYNIEMREQDERDRQDEIDSLWEEEERRWYENEGYRDAFDNDPDAEWNID